MGLAKLAMTEGSKVAEPHKALAAALADNFESVSAKLAAEARMTVTDAMTELLVKDRATLPNGDQKAAWTPFFNAWKVAADQLNAAGTLGSKQSYITALSDTAKGLRAAK
jgi:hypothetical protein